MAKAKSKQQPKQLTLKTVKRVVFEVDYSDLEEFISRVYGVKNWNFVASEECSNDSSHQYEVSVPASKEEKQETEEVVERFIKSGKATYQTGCLLNDCCARGLIEPGNYLINVCW